jgi:hypothetical protein
MSPCHWPQADVPPYISPQRSDEHLCQLTLLSRIERPNGYDLRFLRSWLKRRSMGDLPLVGLDMSVWNEGNEDDFIAIRRRHSDDVLTTWFTDVFVPYWHRTIGMRIKVNPPAPKQCQHSLYYCCPDTLQPTRSAPNPTTPSKISHPTQTLISTAY